MLLFSLFLFVLGASAQSKKAVDVSGPVSNSQFACLKQAGYTAAFVRAYKPEGNIGAFDDNVVANINNAYSAGVTTEIYMTPQTNTTKWGYDQADELHKELKKKGVNVRMIWLQVTSPFLWSNNTINNCGFINEVLMRNRANGYSVGIYTNLNDWTTITGNWQWAGSDVALWYWNNKGSGSNNESPSTFADFKSFGAWFTPSVKQYGINENLCSLTVNLNVYGN